MSEYRNEGFEDSCLPREDMQETGFQHGEPVRPEADKPRRRRRTPRPRHFSKMNMVKNILALIGLGTILVNAARYIVIPVLIWMQSLIGG